MGSVIINNIFLWIFLAFPIHLMKTLCSQLVVSAILVSGLNESVKKGKFVTKIFLSDVIELNSKNIGKMIYADIKANKNNEK